MRKWHSGFDQTLKLVEQCERRRERIAAESFRIERFFERAADLLKIERAQSLSIFLHPHRRKRERRGRGKTLDLPSGLKLAPMRGDFWPVVVQLLFVAGLHDGENRFPASGHFMHDRFESATRAAVFRFERAHTRVEGEGRAG